MSFFCLVKLQVWVCSVVSLCDLMDCRLLGSSVHGIFQARILEWVAISSSRDLLDPGMEPASLASPTLAYRFFTTAPSGKPTGSLCLCVNLVLPKILRLLLTAEKEETYQYQRQKLFRVCTKPFLLFL